MINKKINIGVIADDFTGASDAASFLEKSGAKTIMYNTVENHIEGQCDAVVIALKTRSIEPNEAIIETKKAVDFLNRIGCEKIYFKYCSTFDCTPKGNIGVVADFLMEYANESYTLLCPSLPVNGRTVRNGRIYVDGVKLSKSPLKNHPLNPMWDSYIPNLMQSQSKYPCFVMNREDLYTDGWKQKIKEYQKKYDRFYIIPDYESNMDGEVISEKFGDLSILTGGSGLLAHIFKQKAVCQGQQRREYQSNHQRSVILCGSCSMATKQQVAYYREHKGVCFPIDANKLIDKTLKLQDIINYIEQQQEPVLLYSDAIDYDMRKLKKNDNFFEASQSMEKLLGELSVTLLQKGFTRIVVAGGETSGAVIKRLAYHGFYIGKMIDPGVPELIPLQNEAITLVLKSGNFGAIDFFVKASKCESNE